MRRFGAGFLVVVSTILLVAASLGWWANRDLLDSQRFSTGTVKVLQQTSVQDALTEAITDQISDAAGRDLRLAQPIIAAIVREVVTSTAFQKIFEGALTEVHGAVVDGSAKDAVVNLTEVVGDVRAALKQIAPDLADKIPTQRQIEVQVLDRTQLDLIDRVTGLTRTVTVVLTVLALVGFAGALTLSSRRWKTLAFAGWSVLVAFGFVFVVQVAGRVAIGIAIPNEIDAKAAQDAYGIVSHFVLTTAIVLGIVGLLTALAAGWIDRNGGWSVARDHLRRGARWVRAQVPATGDGAAAPATGPGAGSTVAAAARGEVTSVHEITAGVLAARLPTPTRNARTVHWWRAAVLLLVGIYALVSPGGLTTVVVVLLGLGILWLSLTEGLAALASPRPVKEAKEVEGADAPADEPSDTDTPTAAVPGVD